MSAGLAPLYRRGADPAEGLTVADTLDFVVPLRARQAALRARPTPPMIRVDEIDECLSIVIAALRKRAYERTMPVDLDIGDIDGMVT